MLTASVLATAVATDVAGEDVSDVVLTVGADHAEQNIAWYTTAEGDGKIQWARASAIEGDSFPQAQAESADATASGETHDGRYYFHASMSDLEPATDYVYRVGADGAWSQPHQFTTSDFEARQFSFVAVGDPQLGSSGNVEADREGWEQTLTAALETVPDAAFVLSMGDQVQNAGDEDQYAALLSPDALTAVPFVFNRGNHDADSSTYETHFHLPGDAEIPGNYWFTHDDVLVIGVDSNTLDVDAHDAFIGDVVAEHGADARWRVVTFHHTAFGVAEHSNETELVEFRGEIAPVLSEHGVDLVLMGHDHTYARTHLMDGREPVPAEDPDDLHPSEGQALYLTLNSASGSKYYPLLDEGALADADPQGFDYAQVTWQEEVPTFTQVEVTPGAMSVATYRTDSGEAIDEFVLNHPSGEGDTDGASPSPSAGTASDEQATHSPSATPTDTATEPDGDGPPLAIVGAAAGLAALAIGLAVLVRRKRTNGNV